MLGRASSVRLLSDENPGESEGIVGEEEFVGRGAVSRVGNKGESSISSSSRGNSFMLGRASSARLVNDRENPGESEGIVGEEEFVGRVAVSRVRKMGESSISSSSRGDSFVVGRASSARLVNDRENPGESGGIVGEEEFVGRGAMSRVGKKGESSISSSSRGDSFVVGRASSARLVNDDIPGESEGKKSEEELGVRGGLWKSGQWRRTITTSYQTDIGRPGDMNDESDVNDDSDVNDESILAEAESSAAFEARKKSRRRLLSQFNPPVQRRVSEMFEVSSRPLARESPKGSVIGVDITTISESDLRRQWEELETTSWKSRRYQLMPPESGFQEHMSLYTKWKSQKYSMSMFLLASAFDNPELLFAVYSQPGSLKISATQVDVISDLINACMSKFQFLIHEHRGRLLETE